MKLFLFSSSSSSSRAVLGPLLLVSALLSLSSIRVVDAQGQGQKQGQGKPAWAQNGGNGGGDSMESMESMESTESADGIESIESLESLESIESADSGDGNGGGQGQAQGQAKQNGGGGGQGQAQGQGQAKQNGGGGGGGFKGFGKDKMNGNMFGFKKYHLLSGEMADMTCDQLEMKYEDLKPEMTTLSLKDANKQRKSVRTMYCLKECTGIAEIECEGDFAVNYCNKVQAGIRMADRKARRFAKKIEKRNASQNFPEQAKKKMQAKQTKAAEMSENLTEHFGVLTQENLCDIGK